jgi:hypothetical protein
MAMYPYKNLADYRGENLFYQNQEFSFYGSSSRFATSVTTLVSAMMSDSSLGHQN